MSNVTKRFIVRLNPVQHGVAKRLAKVGFDPVNLPLLARCKAFASSCSCLKQFGAIELPEALAAEARAELAAKPSKAVFEEPDEVHPPVASDPYREQQVYLNSGIGIDVDAAVNLPLANVNLVDIEQGWTLTHEEFSDLKLTKPDGLNHKFHGHGTAVLGVVAAKGGNDRGIAGILSKNLQIKLVSQYWVDELGRTLYNTAEAICLALHKGYVGEGDILLIQAQHLDKSTGLLLPVEADPVAKCVIQCAIAKGVVVIEAAGNGGVYLDGVKLDNGTVFDPAKHSKAIVVGAATADADRRPLFFTNRGTYVQCYAWGEDVTTCGDGETSQEVDDYMPDFGGTSAAAAIVAGVAALIQSVARGLKKGMTGAKLRSLLIDPRFGTPSARGAEPIGVMPDVKRLIAEIKKPNFDPVNP